MAKDRKLSEAEQLLDEIISGVIVANVAPGGEGSARLLLIRLQRLKDLLGDLDQHDDPGWRFLAVGVLLREAARWVAEAIDNIQYKLSPHHWRVWNLERASWIRAEVLPA
jgi:hypothetical protein